MWIIVGVIVALGITEPYPKHGPFETEAACQEFLKSDADLAEANAKAKVYIESVVGKEIADTFETKCVEQKDG